MEYFHLEMHDFGHMAELLPVSRNNLGVTYQIMVIDRTLEAVGLLARSDELRVA
jgi:hypothetical protein